VATAIAWVTVNAQEWARLFQGPSFHIAGVQLLELTASSPAQAAYVVSFTIHRYSGSAPFYYSISGGRTAVAQSDYLPGSSTQNTFYLPAVSVSPWTEIWILCDMSCRAHILV
jgi:hypothetical protein